MAGVSTLFITVLADVWWKVGGFIGASLQHSNTNVCSYSISVTGEHPVYQGRGTFESMPTRWSTTAVMKRV